MVSEFPDNCGAQVVHDLNEYKDLPYEVPPAKRRYKLLVATALAVEQKNAIKYLKKQGFKTVRKYRGAQGPIVVLVWTRK